MITNGGKCHESGQGVNIKLNNKNQTKLETTKQRTWGSLLLRRKKIHKALKSEEMKQGQDG